MSHILNHFSLQVANWNFMVILVLLFVWACVLGCVISSIFSQPFDRVQRVFWISLVVLLPILGVLSYLPFAFRKEELPQLFVRKSKRSKKSRPDESDAES